MLLVWLSIPRGLSTLGLVSNTLLSMFSSLGAASRCATMARLAICINVAPNWINSTER